MNRAWLYKESSSDTEWQISFTEPASHYVCVTPIVWAELQEGEPS